MVADQILTANYKLPTAKKIVFLPPSKKLEKNETL